MFCGVKITKEQKSRDKDEKKKNRKFLERLVGHKCDEVDTVPRLRSLFHYNNGTGNATSSVEHGYNLGSFLELMDCHGEFQAD